MLGHRLEDLIALDKQNYDQIATTLNDPEKQRELLLQDEEEHFLDEACVNPRGNDCPPALKLIACVLLYEITAFLRETYPTIPKSSKAAAKEKNAPWGERQFGTRNLEPSRRWSMALSSMGQSQTSAQSLQSIAGNEPGQVERKISFVLHEPDNESEASSNTTLTLHGDESLGKIKLKLFVERIMCNTRLTGIQRRAAPVRPFLLRRGTSGAPTSSSFKRPSLKLRRGTKDGKELETDCNEFEVCCL